MNIVPPSRALRTRLTVAAQSWISTAQGNQRREEQHGGPSARRDAADNVAAAKRDALELGELLAALPPSDH